MFNCTNYGEQLYNFIRGSVAGHFHFLHFVILQIQLHERMPSVGMLIFIKS